ncbi:eCIS core domain-containing protein [Streptomyces sp. NPDC002623]
MVPANGGRFLDPSVRTEMEGAFGHDFSGVRVHSGGEASELARGLGARAYSLGRDIVVARGESVHGPAGRRLLAHELAHVVQYDVSGRAIVARQERPDQERLPRDIRDLRSTIQAIPADQVRANWAARRQDFIAVAGDPGNSLNSGQIYQIWLRYWMDEHAQARREYRDRDDALRKADMQSYVEKRPKFDAGVRDLYPREYEAAADRLAAAEYYSSYLVGIHDWLQVHVDGMRRHVTLEQVNRKAVELIRARGLREAILAVVIAMAGVPAARSVAPKGEAPREGMPQAGKGIVQKVWGGAVPRRMPCRCIGTARTLATSRPMGGGRHGRRRTVRTRHASPEFLRTRCSTSRRC